LFKAGQICIHLTFSSDSADHSPDAQLIVTESMFAAVLLVETRQRDVRRSSPSQNVTVKGIFKNILAKLSANIGRTPFHLLRPESSNL